jgi:hypothetical protein
VARSRTAVPGLKRVQQLGGPEVFTVKGALREPGDDGDVLPQFRRQEIVVHLGIIAGQR